MGEFNCNKSICNGTHGICDYCKRRLIAQAEKKAKLEVLNDVTKEINKKLHEFAKLSAEHKIHTGVQSKLLVPFMRFHLFLSKKAKELQSEAQNKD